MVLSSMTYSQVTAKCAMKLTKLLEERGARAPACAHGRLIVRTGSGHPTLHVRVAKLAMTDGVAVSKPTTSRMPPSSGSAMLKPFDTIPITTSLAPIAILWRYARSAWTGWMSPAQVSLSVYTQKMSTGTLFSAAQSMGSAQSVPPNGRSLTALTTWSRRLRGEIAIDEIPLPIPRAEYIER